MTLEELEKRLTVLEDTKEIEHLGRKYGYYLEHWMVDEILDLFSDSPNAGLEWPDGKHFGKKGVKKYFKGMEEYARYSRVSPSVNAAFACRRHRPGREDSQGKMDRLRMFCRPRGRRR